MIRSSTIFCRARFVARYLLTTARAVCLFLGGQAAAHASVTVAKTQDYIPSGHWQVSLAVGHGRLQSPLSDGDDIKFGVLPSIKYYGERFYLENTSLGYSLYESPRFAIDLAGRLNSDGLFFPGSGNYLIESIATLSQFQVVDIPEPEPMAPPKRRLSYLAGFSMHWLGPVNIDLGVLGDISGTHGGNEVELTAAKRLAIGDFMAGLELGVTYKSHALVDYYYGADMIDPLMMEPMPLYHPGEALNSHLKLEGRYQFSDKISFLAAGRLDRLGNEIWNSPFVIRRDTQSFFVGLQYSL